VALIVRKMCKNTLADKIVLDQNICIAHQENGYIYAKTFSKKNKFLRFEQREKRMKKVVVFLGMLTFILEKFAEIPITIRCNSFNCFFVSAFGLVQFVSSKDLPLSEWQSMQESRSGLGAISEPLVIESEEKKTGDSKNHIFGGDHCETGENFCSCCRRL